MHSVEYTMKVLREKIEENFVLCIGMGDNPYFKYDSDKPHENDEIFILDEEKTIIITDKQIVDIEKDKNIPIFMSRVFEHLWSYPKNISHLSKITNKLYLIVPDMKRVYEEHLKKNIEVVKKIGCSTEKFNRDVIEIFSSKDCEWSLNDLHAIWTDKESMLTLLPEPYFTINELSEIDNINGYPHLFLEVEINEEISLEKANLLFKYSQSKPLIDLGTVVDVKKLIGNFATRNVDKDEFWDIEQTSTVSPKENILVFENYFAEINNADMGYGIFTLSNVIQSGGVVCFVEIDCDQIIRKLIDKKYTNGVEFFKLNNLLFSPNHLSYSKTKQRTGWTSPEFTKIMCEWEGLFREINPMIDISNELHKEYIMCLEASLDQYYFLKVFEKI